MTILIAGTAVVLLQPALAFLGAELLTRRCKGLIGPDAFDGTHATDRVTARRDVANIGGGEAAMTPGSEKHRDLTGIGPPP